ncbi:hypothetical protein L7F22_009176 [Adiantum nelumboides]|nr:hypothetical protein [Adiantum nelumboides]
MDLIQLGGKLGLGASEAVIRKAQELERLSKVRFDPSAFGLGEVCKSVLCFELACSQLRVAFDRHTAICISGLSEKAYIRSLTNMQNALGLRLKVDVRELAIQFGCVRLIASVQRSLAQYKQRFVASLPETRRSSADFSRGVFIAVAFYLCAKRNKLKVDKMRLIEVCGTSESEFAMVSSSMLDLCFDLVGLERERKEPHPLKCKKDSVELASKRKIFALENTAKESNLFDEDFAEISQLLKKSRASCEAC